MSKYIRTEVKSFWELPDPQQEYQRNELGKDAELSTYVQDPLDENNYLPLSNFVITRRKLFDGVFGLSYFSGYFVKFSSDNETCVVAYRHW